MKTRSKSNGDSLNENHGFYVNMKKNCPFVGCETILDQLYSICHFIFRLIVFIHFEKNFPETSSRSIAFVIQGSLNNRIYLQLRCSNFHLSFIELPF